MGTVFLYTTSLNLACVKLELEISSVCDGGGDRGSEGLILFMLQSVIVLGFLFCHL